MWYYMIRSTIDIMTTKTQCNTCLLFFEVLQLLCLTAVCDPNLVGASGSMSYWSTMYQVFVLTFNRNLTQDAYKIIANIYGAPHGHTMISLTRVTFASTRAKINPQPLRNGYFRMVQNRFLKR